MHLGTSKKQFPKDGRESSRLFSTRSRLSIRTRTPLAQWIRDLIPTCHNLHERPSRSPEMLIG
jgi:hypothetical protein